MTNTLFKFLGIEPQRVSHTEKLISGLGAVIGIFLVFYTSTLFVQGSDSYLIVASLGASAVLLFAVPHGPLSQPWALIGGHGISAIIGVSCAKLIPDAFIAAPLAVGIAVSAMYYMHCIHPPGGATALSAVVGGSSVHELGYQFVLTPVLINVITILLVAISFNYFFKWRRYPAYLAKKQQAKAASVKDSRYGAITHEDFVYALSEIDSFIDISENDLLKIYDLVTQHHKSTGLGYQNLLNGHYYCNGEAGDNWAVRQIVDWAETGVIKENTVDDAGEQKLIYKVIAGENRRSSAVMTKNAFAKWARYEVIRDENNWRRVDVSE